MLRSTPQASTCMPARAWCASMLRSTTGMPPWVTISSWLAALYTARSFKAWQPASCTAAALGCAAMARSTARMPPEAAASAWHSALQAAALRTARQPASCRACASRCSAMAAAMAFRPPAATRRRVFSAWPAQSTCNARTHATCTSAATACFSIAFITASMPPRNAISPRASGLRAASSQSERQPRSCAWPLDASAMAFRMLAAGTLVGAEGLASGRWARCLCCGPGRACRPLPRLEACAGSVRRHPAAGGSSFLAWSPLAG
mmetsp:Transcript_228/g.725  ORF Transcript_228/g.725 Transcript_228/m.725 type:complete len:262 (-) Transcript_228:100-885(-)